MFPAVWLHRYLGNPDWCAGRTRRSSGGHWAIDYGVFGDPTAKEGDMTTHGQTGRDAASSEGTVTVTETSAGVYTQQIAAGHHRLVADEPRPIGDDIGPTPTICYLPGSVRVRP
jgi:hypothetical protein